MDITPELIEATSKAIINIIAAIGAVVATVASAVAGFYTWKNRYELDRLYATTYRPNPDGTPGPMRHHPTPIVKLFHAGGNVPPLVVPPTAVIAQPDTPPEPEQKP